MKTSQRRAPLELAGNLRNQEATRKGIVRELKRYSRGCTRAAAKAAQFIDQLNVPAQSLATKRDLLLGISLLPEIDAVRPSGMVRRLLGLDSRSRALVDVLLPLNGRAMPAAVIPPLGAQRNGVDSPAMIIDLPLPSNPIQREIVICRQIIARIERMEPLSDQGRAMRAASEEVLSDEDRLSRCEASADDIKRRLLDVANKFDPQSGDQSESGTVAKVLVFRPRSTRTEDA